ncbi:MAG: FAD-dependent oxidoreductase [Actinomycetes bacterium]
MPKAIIIGAGVIGASIALELARSGYHVLVLDKGPGIGTGSTSASSAVVRFNYSTFDSVALAWEAFHCWKNWREHLGVNLPAYTQLHDVGVIMLDVPVMSIEGTQALFRAAGIPFERWSSSDLEANATYLDSGSYWPPKSINDEAFYHEATSKLGAIYTPNGGYIDDPKLAAENLAAAAAALGAVFRFKSEVTKFDIADGHINGLWVNGEYEEADIVVNACGPWSAKVNELAGVGDDFTISLRPMRQEVHQVDTPRGLLPGPIVGDVDLGTYMRPASNGSLLVGGTEPECDPLEWVEDVDLVNMNRTAERFEAQVTRAARRLPALQIPNAPMGIVGVYDVAADWTPIYDRTSIAGFYVAVGTSGNQFKNAPAVGQLMAFLISHIEAGHNHDEDPLIFIGEHTKNEINLGAFSRKRPYNSLNTHSVMG